MRCSSWIPLSIFLALLPAAPPALAAVNDIFPGDFFPSPPGTTTLSLYAYDRAQSGPYMNSKKLLNGQLDSDVLALRLVQSFQLRDTTVSSVLALPWTDSEVSPQPLANVIGKTTRGFTDLRLGAAAWLINDRANAHYFAATGMVVLPTGDYDKTQLLNAGENRWKFILAAGWQKDFTPQLLVELAPEIAFYGDNDAHLGSNRLEQRPSYALTGYLRHRTTPTWHIHLGGQINRGGETRINGIAQHNAPNNDRITLGSTWFLPDKQQVILRLARDVAIDNGFRSEQEIALRYQKSF
jgi:hypothetical protein